MSLGGAEKDRVVCDTPLHGGEVYGERALAGEGEAAGCVCFPAQPWIYIHIRDASSLSRPSWLLGNRSML